jgi:hypothetical protein
VVVEGDHFVPHIAALYMPLSTAPVSQADRW